MDRFLLERMGRRYLKEVAVTVMSVIFIGILFLFWTEEYQFYMLRELPDDAPKIGMQIAVNGPIDLGKRSKFIHFYSSHCHISKVNMEHVSLVLPEVVKNFDCFIMLLGDTDTASMRKTYDIPASVKLIANVDDSTVASYGVYTTPQAVVLNSDNTLYFRGNYSIKSGICGPNDIKRAAPIIALDFKLKNNPSPIFSNLQNKVWGCTF